jgi:hypothetical protein
MPWSLVETGRLEDVHQSGQPLVDPGARLVVLGQFTAGFRSVGQKRGHGHLGRIEEDLLDPPVAATVRPVAEQVGLELER